MKRELSSRFKNMSIEGSRSSLYARLKNTSKEKREFDLRYHALVRIVSTIVRNTQFPKEQIELFDKSRRVAKSNLPGVRLLGKYFGLPNSREYNVNISRDDFEDFGQPFPPFDPDEKAYWSSSVLDLDKIKSPSDQEKIRLALLAYGESSRKLENYLSEYLIGNRSSSFLKKEIPILTLGKLYDYNEDWFNIFVEGSYAFKDEDLFKQDDEDEEIKAKAENLKSLFVAKLEKLKEVLES